VGEFGDARQAEKAARALDGVNMTEETGDKGGIALILLETQKLRRRRVDVLRRFLKKSFSRSSILSLAPAAAANEDSMDARS
jgi:hypothetical protein